MFHSLLGSARHDVNKLEVNLQNARKRILLIETTYYPRYKRDGLSALQAQGALWFTRKDLESARYYYTGGREGYAVSDRVEDTLKLHLLDPRFKALKAELDAAELKVQEMEHAKGYTFLGVNNNSILYKEISTGKTCTAQESSQL